METKASELLQFLSENAGNTDPRPFRMDEENKKMTLRYHDGGGHQRIMSHQMFLPNPGSGKHYPEHYRQQGEDRILLSRL